MKRLIPFLGFLLPFAAIAQSFQDSSELLPAETSSTHATVVCDFNNDGLDDIGVLDAGSNLWIYSQQGDGTFVGNNLGALGEDAPFGFYAWGACAADIDRSGERDLFASGAYDGLRLVLSEGGGEFMMDEIPNVFVFAQASNFVDINRDGFIDLFICHDDGESAVLYNDGSGQFSMNYSDLDPALYGSGENDSGNYGSVWSDVNNDGMVDLYISKCRQGVGENTDPRRINQLWLAQEDGSYVEDALTAGVADGAQSWSADFGDIDNDGDMDLFIGNHTNNSRLMLNDGTGVFTDISFSSGLAELMTFLVIQSCFRDFDNDGLIDILVTGGGQYVLAHNNGDNTFSAIDAFPESSYNSFGLGDFNNDGYEDVFSISGGYGGFGDVTDKLLLNDGGENNWIKFDLEGVESNIDGIGARITIEGPFGTQIRDVKAGESYGIQNSLTVHFGLGTAAEVEMATITWPSGIIQEIPNPAINTQHEVLEESTVGVSSVAKTESIEVYPNPFESTLNINLNNLSAKVVSVEIRDLSGRLVFSEYNAGAFGSLDLSALTSGIYQLILSTQTEQLSTKVVKQ